MTEVRDPTQQKLIDSDMTMAEFQALVKDLVQQTLATRPGYKLYGDRSPAEVATVLEAMWKNIIKTEPGTPSPTEMLREERGAVVQTFVIDTTIFVQAYIEDTLTEHVKVLFNSVLDPEPSTLHISEFCIVECANIIWKRVRFSGMPTEVSRTSLYELIAAPVTIHNATDYLPRALEIGLTHELAVYDSIFIALAQTLDCPLITADTQQTRVARSVGVVLKPVTDFKPLHG